MGILMGFGDWDGWDWIFKDWDFIRIWGLGWIGLDWISEDWIFRWRF
jgi:hypothetical protein